MEELDRGDLAAIIEEQRGIPAQTVIDVLEALSTVLPAQLAEYGRVEIYHLGVFKLSERKARTGRNFETNEPVMIPYRMKVGFTASNKFASAIEDVIDIPTY